MIPLLAGLWLALAPADLPPETDYIAVDVRTREVIESRWEDPFAAIPAGSLVKPFTALAHAGPFPEFECRGAAGGCWRRQAHGKLRFVEALAESCNAYFLQLARGVNAAALEVTAASFALPPPASPTAQARIGLGEGWRVPPLALLRAYAELAVRRGDPGVDAILAGLERAAQSGTARALRSGAPRLPILAKTGTAPCTAPRRHAGDGLAVAVYPAGAPRLALLVRVHNVPGAEAARIAGRLLKALERR